MRKLPKRAQPSLKAAVSSLRQYADSFEGLTVGMVRKRLAAGKLTQKKWDGGKQLVATFPTHEVRVFFAGGKAMLTSVQILSK
jgi:hypothetical protein